MTIAFISHPDCSLHNPGFGHPECPSRLKVITDAIAASNLVDSLHYETAPAVTHEQLLRVHESSYLEALLELAPKENSIRVDPDTIMCPQTLPAAFYAAGAVVKAVDMVLSDLPINSAFCNVRPPGHHAERSTAMGFCFFNNVAIGVAHALAEHNLKRIAIIDFDVHRGNGTEDIFQNHPAVLICSIYEEFLYPFGSPPKGAKNIIDIPLSAGSTGREFRAEVTQHALERIDAFKPELIFFSAGFDAHRRDMISHLNLTEPDYLWVTQQIKRIADKHAKGRMVSVLEGGYALEVLGQCVVAHLTGFLT